MSKLYLLLLSLLLPAVSCTPVYRGVLLNESDSAVMVFMKSELDARVMPRETSRVIYLPLGDKTWNLSLKAGSCQYFYQTPDVWQLGKYYQEIRVQVITIRIDRRFVLHLTAKGPDNSTKEIEGFGFPLSPMPVCSDVY